MLYNFHEEEEVIFLSLLLLFSTSYRFNVKCAIIIFGRVRHMVPEFFNSSHIPVIDPKSQNLLYSKSGMVQTVRAHTMPHTQSRVGVPSVIVCTCTSRCMWNRKCLFGILAIKRSVSAAAEMNLRNLLHAGKEACKQARNLPWFWNPEVQNRVMSGPKEGLMCSKNVYSIQETQQWLYLFCASKNIVIHNWVREKLS